MTTATKTKLETTCEQIEAVILDNVPTMTTERNFGRKNQAAMARQLFKTLGIKGVSVTAENYSMASTVSIRMPEKETTGADFVLDGVNYRGQSWSDMPSDVPAKIINSRRYRAQGLLGSILSIAFPNCDDRSDSQSDYFDSCWSYR